MIGLEQLQSVLKVKQVEVKSERARGEPSVAMTTGLYRSQDKAYPSHDNGPNRSYKPPCAERPTTQAVERGGAIRGGR